MRNVNDVKLHLTLQFLGNGDKHSLLVLIDQRFDPCEHVHLEHKKASYAKIKSELSSIMLQILLSKSLTYCG